MQSYLPSPACTQQMLKQFVLEFVLAVSKYFEFQGRIDPAPMADANPQRYSSATEALMLVDRIDELSLFSIENRSFHLLIDLYEDGIELLFKALEPEADAWLNEFHRIANRILRHLHS